MDDNKIERMTMLGFSKEMENLKNGVCVFCKSIKTNKSDFDDALSWKEFQNSGICQKCQDEIFKEDFE